MDSFFPSFITGPLLKSQQSTLPTEKANYFCSAIESLVPFLGSVAISIYRQLPSTLALDHLLFLALPRSFLGEWLYVIDDLSKHFCCHHKQTPWMNFFAKYSQVPMEKGELAILVQFRNEVRHGSASLDLEILEQVNSILQHLLSKLDFALEYKLYGGKLGADKNYIMNVAEQEEVLENITDIWLEKNTEQIHLSPLLQYKNNHLQLHFPKTKNAPEFFQQMRWEDRFLHFNKEKEGVLQRDPCSGKLLVEFKEFAQQIDCQGKILLNGEVGAGKTHFIKNLDAYLPKQSVFSYCIEESPLRINPLLALKAICLQIAQGEKLELPQKNLDEISVWLEFLTMLKGSRYILAIDGLFSPFTPYLPETYRENWLYILGCDFPKNITWLVTGCAPRQIPRFYEKQWQFPAISSLFDDKKQQEFGKGNLKISREYLKQENTLSKELLRYFCKLTSALQVYEIWHKKTLILLAQSAPWSIKDLAEKLDIFTPQMEKFLYQISFVLSKKEEGYVLYHPIFAHYLKFYAFKELPQT